MTRREFAQCACLAACLFLLVNAWNVADAKTAHLTLEKRGEARVLKVQYDHGDSYSKNIFVAPRRLSENYLPYHDQLLFGPDYPVYPYWEVRQRLGYRYLRRPVLGAAPGLYLRR